MGDPVLAGDASFGISKHRPDLKAPMDMAIDRIKTNGVYDRINTQFLPFRVN
jgi:ABC-type amino acid transport substrate-binding protein